MSKIDDVIKRNEVVEEHRLQLLTERNYYKRQFELKSVELQGFKSQQLFLHLLIVLLVIALFLVLGMVRYVYH